MVTAALRARTSREAKALLAGIGSERLDNPTLERNVAMAQLAVGSELLANGAADEALKMLRPSLATLERRACRRSRTTRERQRDLSLAANAVGDALLAKGQIDEALQRYREALAIRERLVVLDPKNDAGGGTSRSRRSASATCSWRRPS